MLVATGIGTNPQPDQNENMQKVTQIVREAGWQMRKNPALLTDRGEVVVSLAEKLKETDVQALKDYIEKTTGYKLSWKE